MNCIVGNIYIIINFFVFVWRFFNSKYLFVIFLFVFDLVCLWMFLIILIVFLMILYFLKLGLNYLYNWIYFFLIFVDVLLSWMFLIWLLSFSFKENIFVMNKNNKVK